MINMKGWFHGNAPHSEGPCLVYCSTVKFLIILALNLCFVSKSNRTMEHVCKQRRLTKYVCLVFLTTPFAYSVRVALRARNSTGLTMHRSSGRCKVSTNNV